MSGNYAKMIADDNALRLATEASNVEGLSSFKQILQRAEKIKAARCSIYPVLESITVQYGDQPLDYDEMVAVIRQFYGELTEDEMRGIMKEFKALWRACDEDTQRMARWRKQHLIAAGV